MFTRGSRYADVEDAKITVGTEVIHYKRIRFIPETKAYVKHTVKDGERLDHIAFQYYQDSERFWRICDANRAVWPDDLTDGIGASLWVPPLEE